MFSNLLVAVSPGVDHSAAVTRVQWLARQGPVKVTLYSAVYDNTDDLPGYDSAAERTSIQSSMCDSQLRRLDEIKNHLAGLCDSVDVVCDWDSSPAHGIERTALAVKADLILLAAHEHSRVARLFRDNTDWELVRQSQIPLLLCREAAQAPYRGVLAAVTPISSEAVFVELDERIIGRAKSLTSEISARLMVGHVHPPPDSAALLTVPPVCETVLSEQDHERALHRLLDRHGIPVEDARLIADEPALGIIRLAELFGVDLIVMGALAESKLDGRSLGLIAEKVLAGATCDVLIEHG